MVSTLIGGSQRAQQCPRVPNIEVVEGGEDRDSGGGLLSMAGGRLVKSRRESCAGCH